MLATALIACGPAPERTTANEFDTDDASVQQADREVDEDDAGTASEPVPHARCDEPIMTLDFTGKPEGEPGFDEELQRLDSLDDDERTLRFATESLSPFFREVIAYSLMVPVAELGELVIADLITGTGLARGVALAFLDGDGIRPDIRVLRRSLHRFYFCERELPLFLSDVREIAGEMDPNHIIEVLDSRPKAHTRRLTANAAGTLMFAETLVEGEVRETEVLWSNRRSDGALDFLVYDENGDLQDGSYFKTSQGPETPEASPFSCMACHRDRFNGTGFTITFP